MVTHVPSGDGPLCGHPAWSAAVADCKRCQARLDAILRTLADALSRGVDLSDRGEYDRAAGLLRGSIENALRDLGAATGREEG